MTDQQQLEGWPADDGDAVLDRLHELFEFLRHSASPSDRAAQHLSTVTEAMSAIRARRRVVNVQVLADPSQQQLGPFARDSETSRQAAIANYPKQGTQRWRVLDYIGRRPDAGRKFGATRNEMAYALDLVESTIRPRVVELIAGGWIEESEKTRQTDTGSAAAVLVMTPKGRERWRQERDGR